MISEVVREPSMQPNDSCESDIVERGLLASMSSIVYVWTSSETSRRLQQANMASGDFARLKPC